MPGTPRKASPVKFEVLVSFDSLEKGDTFTQAADDLDWANQHVESGYVRVVTEEEPHVRGEDDKG